MRCEAQIKFSSKEERDSYDILFNPNSENPVVSILGEKTFKMFELKENIEEKSFVIEEYEDRSLTDLAVKHTLISHHYLSSSPHIAVLTDSATLIVDYKGVVVQRIEETGCCLSNWA